MGVVPQCRQWIVALKQAFSDAFAGIQLAVSHPSRKRDESVLSDSGKFSLMRRRFVDLSGG